MLETAIANSQYALRPRKAMSPMLTRKPVSRQIELVHNLMMFSAAGLVRGFFSSMLPIFRAFSKALDFVLQSMVPSVVSPLRRFHKFTRARVFVTSAVIILVTASCAALLFWHSSYWQSIVGGVSSERLWHGASCRARLFAQKAQGEIPDLSWVELWALVQPSRGFRCIEGLSLEASVQFSSTASNEDRGEGARIFRERCAACHGSDGSGGPHAPSLTRPALNHGDSDLAIYKILRDGIPGTSMPSAGLPLNQIVQVTAQVRMLQANLQEALNAETPRPTIQVTSERLKAAGTKPDEWLTYSGSYNGSRHAPTAEITPANVAMLRVRWIKQFDSND